MVELEDLAMHLVHATDIEVAAHGLIPMTSDELGYIIRRFGGAAGVFGGIN